MASDAATEKVIEESAVKEQIVKVVREFLTVKITVPLGSPVFKELHTNSYVWIPLSDYFPVANFEEIVSFIITSGKTRTLSYTKDRWYIEAITINNDGNKFTMDLTLNPFASGNDEYYKNMSDFAKAFSDATKSDSKAVSNSVASTGANTTLKGGAGTVVDNKVKEIVGSETDPLKKAKAIDSWLNKNVSYSRYCCGKYGTNAEKAYNNRSHLNCGDTAMLTTAMMRSAGLSADVVWAPGHFWTRIQINGKNYYSDQTSKYRGWNEVYHNMKYTSVKGTWCGCEAYSC